MDTTESYRQGEADGERCGDADLRDAPASVWELLADLAQRIASERQREIVYPYARYERAYMLGFARGYRKVVV